MSVVASLESVVDKLKDAKAKNVEMQSKAKVGSPAWLLHDGIDARLHEAIVALDQ